MTGTLVQLRALLALRWQMLRAPGARLAFVLVVLLALWVLRAVAVSGRALDPVLLQTAVDLAPAAFLGFGLLAMIAPLTAGGGQAVVPPDELVSFPVRPGTHFLSGVVLAPANLVWAVQLISVIALTAYLTLGGSAWRGAVTTAAFALCITVLGQAFAWTVVGLRQRPSGRLLVNAAAAAAALCVLVVFQQGWGDAALARSPTRLVVDGVVAGGQGAVLRWSATTAVLLALTVAAAALGVLACGWALRQPVDAQAGRHTELLRRRPAQRGALRELVAVDRASVWRAPALRRGGAVLVVLPGLVAAVLAIPWTSLLVLPGLVAAGAGLLFGVNAFALDASGAVWLASMPSDPVLLLRSKLIVLTETVLAAVVLAAVGGSSRSPGAATPAELPALASSAPRCTAVVVHSVAGG